MSKAEQFIRKCTRTCSNELVSIQSADGKNIISYHEWLTPEQALRAVEIAKSEQPKEVYLCILRYDDGRFKMISGCFSDYNKAVKYAAGNPRIAIQKLSVI